jgi:hypothetical protein
MTEIGKELLARASRRFRAAEMMVLAGSVFGRKLDQNSLVAQVRHDMASRSVFKMMIARYNVSEERLNSKLASTPSDLREAILERLNEWQGLDPEEAMASNGLPSIATLQRMALIEPNGPAAWGYFSLRVGMTNYEFVLREPELAASAEAGRPDELAAELVRLAETSEDPATDDMVMSSIYRIVKSTGYRRCMVVSDGFGTKLSEIPVPAFLSDLYDKTLKNLVLAGVNAPDCFVR